MNTRISVIEAVEKHSQRMELPSLESLKAKEAELLKMGDNKELCKIQGEIAVHSLAQRFLVVNMKSLAEEFSMTSEELGVSHPLFLLFRTGACPRLSIIGASARNSCPITLWSRPDNIAPVCSLEGLLSRPLKRRRMAFLIGLMLALMASAAAGTFLIVENCYEAIVITAAVLVFCVGAGLAWEIGGKCNASLRLSMFLNGIPPKEIEEEIEKEKGFTSTSFLARVPGWRKCDAFYGESEEQREEYHVSKRLLEDEFVLIGEKIVRTSGGGTVHYFFKVGVFERTVTSNEFCVTTAKPKAQLTITSNNSNSKVGPEMSLDSRAEQPTTQATEPEPKTVIAEPR